MRGSQRVEQFQACVVLVAGVVLVLHGLQGCGKPAPAFRALSGHDAAATGGAPGLGGAMEDPDPMPPTGGAGGKVDAGRTGGTGGRADAAVKADTAVMPPPDVAAPTAGAPGTGGAPVVAEDAAAGGTGGEVAPDAMPDTRPTIPDTRPVSSGPAACNPDPQVIEICKQLEPACQNCPDRTIWNECFAVAARGDDAACARYAVNNHCTVDQGGNWCGTLNCDAPGCPRTNCRTVQGNGASDPCQALIDECPCN